MSLLEPYQATRCPEPVVRPLDTYLGQALRALAVEGCRDDKATDTADIETSGHGTGIKKRIQASPGGTYRDVAHTTLLESLGAHQRIHQDICTKCAKIVTQP